MAEAVGELDPRGGGVVGSIGMGGTSGRGLRPTAGWAFAAIGVALAVGVAGGSAHLSATYIHELGSPCGTGRLSCWSMLTLVVPAWLLGPAATWGVCWLSGEGQGLARTATLAGLGAWLTCLAVICLV